MPRQVYKIFFVLTRTTACYLVTLQLAKKESQEHLVFPRSQSLKRGSCQPQELLRQSLLSCSYPWYSTSRSTCYSGESKDPTKWVPEKSGESLLHDEGAASKTKSSKKPVKAPFGTCSLQPKPQRNRGTP